MDDLRDKLISLLDRTNEEKKNIIKWLYEALSVLDGKASALLRINGIFMALLAAILFLPVRDRVALPLLVEICIAVALAMFLISSWYCHRIAWVEWDFLGKAIRDSAAPVPAYNFDGEIDALVEVANKRAKCFRRAWYLSPIAVLLVILSSSYLLFTLPKAPSPQKAAGATSSSQAVLER